MTRSFWQLQKKFVVYVNIWERVKFLEETATTSAKWVRVCTEAISWALFTHFSLYTMQT